MAFASGTQLFLGALVALVISRILRIIYRLTLHPLAKIPGPKLAAATSLYEFYYDICLGGVWIFEIERLHQIYGRDVRLP